MAKNMQPILKRCEKLNISPAVMGYDKQSNKRQKSQTRPKKKSEYSIQLNEKQKVKFIYGVLEKQFRMYYEKATKMEGKTGDNLLSLIERRLDNVVFRLGFAKTRRQSRQLVNHGHFTINGKRVDIPSYIVKPGEVIAVCDKARSNDFFKALKEKDVFIATPKWLDVNRQQLEGKVLSLPERSDIDYEVAEHLIVELYSK